MHDQKMTKSIPAAEWHNYWTGSNNNQAPLSLVDCSTYRSQAVALKHSSVRWLDTLNQAYKDLTFWIKCTKTWLLNQAYKDLVFWIKCTKTWYSESSIQNLWILSTFVLWIQKTGKSGFTITRKRFIVKENGVYSRFYSLIYNHRKSRIYSHRNSYNSLYFFFLFFFSFFFKLLIYIFLK